MKVDTYTPVMNKGELQKMKDSIVIKRNRWIDHQECSHPLKFRKPIGFKEKNVYFLFLFGKDDGFGRHIPLNIFQNQCFLIITGNHWFQQKDNIMWLVNITVAVLAIVTASKSII